MTISYPRLLRELERELLHQDAVESELPVDAHATALTVASGPLRSLRFAHDADLQAVALGRLRLGRSNDPPYPVPLRSQGLAIRKVQQALIDLGYPLPRSGDDSRYGEETYQAVLAYKRYNGIRTDSGYLDGIVGPKTIRYLDSQFPTGPLPTCSLPGAPTVASAEGEFETGAPIGGIPWITCNPLIEPSPDGMCNKRLPDRGTLRSEGGGAIGTSLVGGFYCVNLPHIHLEFTATWVEMLPPSQRTPDQRNRAPSAPRYDVTFKGYRDEGLIPGHAYKRDITVAAPGIGSLDFVTLLQRNRIFQIDYSISES